jgi:hypothetical protein
MFQRFRFLTWFGLSFNRAQPARLFVLAAAFVSSALWASGPGHKGHAHAHGQASAQISLQGKLLKGEIHGAMDNFLSFEHAPRTDAQRAELRALQEKLKDVSWLLVPAPAAQCKLVALSTESVLFQAAGPVKGHADLDVDFGFECANPAALTSIRFTSLDRGRRMKKLAVEFVGPTGQKAVTLTQTKPVLEIK